VSSGDGMKPKEWISALQARLDRQPRLLVAGAAAAAVLFLWMIYVPPSLEIRRLGVQWRSLRAESRQSRQLLDEFYQGGAALLPGSGHLPKVLEMLHDKALQHGVKIRGVTPGNAREPSAEGLSVFPVEIQMEGEFHSLGEFLGELRDPSVLGMVEVRRFRISRDEGLLPVLRADLSLEIALRQE